MILIKFDVTCTCEKQTSSLITGCTDSYITVDCLGMDGPCHSAFPFFFLLAMHKLFNFIYN